MHKALLVWTLAGLAPLMGACSSESQSANTDAGMTGMGDGGDTSAAAIPNPALVIANGGDGKVSIIDPSTLKVVSTFAVDSGMHPHHISISPDKKRVLVTATSADLSMGHTGGGHGGGHGSTASTMVFQLDVATKEFKSVITIDATAHNAAFTPDGSTIVLGMMEHGMIVGHDATTFAEKFSVMGFQMPLEVTPTNVGSLLVAESGAARVALVNLATKTISTTFDVGATPVAAWASGGSNYFVSVEEGMKVKHLVEASSNVTMDTHTIDPGGMPGQAILTPNGAELWVAVEDRSIVDVFDATTHAKLAEFAAGTKPHGIAFEPGGARAFVTDEDGSRVLVVDVAGRSVSSEIPVAAKPNGIVWLAR